MAVISLTVPVAPASSANAAASPGGAVPALPVPGVFDALLAQTLGQAEGLPVEALTITGQAPEQFQGAAVAPEDAQAGTASVKENELLQLMASLVTTLPGDTAGWPAYLAAQPGPDAVAHPVEVLPGLSPDAEYSGALLPMSLPALAGPASHGPATPTAVTAEAPALLPRTLFTAIPEGTPGARAIFSELTELNDPLALFEPFLEATAPAVETAEADRSVRPLFITPSAVADSAVSAPSGTVPGVATAETPLEKVIHIPQPPSSPAWRDAFASNVRTLVLDGGGVAELRLDPPDLGPVHIRIELADQTTNVTFAAAREDTRAAIADALPLLKDLLAESGIALDGATVNDNVPRREAQAERASAAHRPADAEAPIEVRLNLSDRLVDTYA